MGVFAMLVYLSYHGTSRLTTKIVQDHPKYTS